MTYTAHVRCTVTYPYDVHSVAAIVRLLQLHATVAAAVSSI